jgi:hypothetical protein
MDPLNKQERTEAFLKMLALFLISIVIVAIPIYYAFKLPEKERSASSSEYESVKKQLEESKLHDMVFMMKTDSVITIYNQFAQQKDNLERDRMQLRFVSISNKMEDYSKTIKNDTIKPKLYGNVVFSLNKLFSNKNDLFSLEDKLAKAPTGGGSEAPKEDTRSLLEKQIELLKKSLALHGGHKNNAAKELGMSERMFNSLLKEYKLN